MAAFTASRLGRCVAAVVMSAVTACSAATHAANPVLSATAVRAGSSVAATTGSVSTTTVLATVESAPVLATTARTAPGHEVALRSAVRAFWDVYLAVGGHTGPFDGEATRRQLAERSTGAELNRLLAYFSSNAAAGYVVRGGIEIAPTAVSISATTAQVRDCYDDTTGLYRVRDNSRVDIDNPLRHQVLLRLALQDGVWKVAAIGDEGDGCHV